MRIHELKKPEGSTKAPKRIGRGQGTGQGTTAGRGMNGQNSTEDSLREASPINGLRNMQRLTLRILTNSTMALQ